MGAFFCVFLVHHNYYSKLKEFPIGIIAKYLLEINIFYISYFCFLSFWFFSCFSLLHYRPSWFQRRLLASRTQKHNHLDSVSQRAVCPPDGSAYSRACWHRRHPGPAPGYSIRISMLWVRITKSLGSLF